jgi:hypothetical protein
LTTGSVTDDTAHPSRFDRVSALLTEQGCAHLVAIDDQHTAHLAGYSRYQGAPVSRRDDYRRTSNVRRAPIRISRRQQIATADDIVAYRRGDMLDFHPLRSLAIACQQYLRRHR